MAAKKRSLDELVAALRRLEQELEQELEQLEPELEDECCAFCEFDDDIDACDDCDCHDEVDPRLLKAEADLKALLDAVKQRP